MVACVPVGGGTLCVCVVWSWVVCSFRAFLRVLGCFMVFCELRALCVGALFGRMWFVGVLCGCLLIYLCDGSLASLRICGCFVGLLVGVGWMLFCPMLFDVCFIF